MIYCKLCGHNVADISHYAKKHNSYLQMRRKKAHAEKPHVHKIRTALVKRPAREGYPHYEQSAAGYPYYRSDETIVRYCPTCGKPR